MIFSNVFRFLEILNYLVIKTPFDAYFLIKVLQGIFVEIDIDFRLQFLIYE